MEQFVGLIIFLVVIVIGRVLEAMQKKQIEERKKNMPRQQQQRPRQRLEPSSRRQQQPQQRQEPSAQGGYRASQDDVEDFLRQIGMLPPKEEPRPERQPQHEPAPVEVPHEEYRHEPSQATEPIPQPVPAPVELAEHEHNLIESRETILSSESKPPVAKTDRGKPAVNRQRRKVMSLLRNKESVKTAFILNEVLQPPLALRRRR